MTAFVRCQHLREHDDLDFGYDSTFNDRSYHECLFLNRKVIPHDECRETCPGYTPEDMTQPSAMRGATPPARRVARKNSGISHEAMRREIEKIERVIEKIDAALPSESALIEAKSRLTAQQAQLDELLEEQRSRQASLQRQIEEASVARTNVEQAYAWLLQQRERHEVPERVRILLSTRLLPALERCCDPLEDADVSDIQRFLDDARSALVAPPLELEKIMGRLQGMRLP